MEGKCHKELFFVGQSFLNHRKFDIYCIKWINNLKVL